MRRFIACHVRDIGRNAPRAQSMVEFALVLPLFLWITIGIVDLGRGIATYSVISNAAHEGSRAGIFPATTDNETAENSPFVSAVNSVTFFLGDIPNSPTGVDPGTGTYFKVGATDGATTWMPSRGTIAGQPALTTQRASGNSIIVSIYYRFYPVTPLLSNLVGSSINLSAKSTMPIE